jgi:phosphoglycerate dehydrogenase-like enzyme
VPLSELLRVSDFVSVHVPLIPETKHLLGPREFAGMKEGSVLVNTARGAVIDTDALVAYISRFRGVALDVLEDESGFGAGHPLLAFPNVLITPHIAFYTDTSLVRIAGETERLITEYESSGKGG